MYIFYLKLIGEDHFGGLEKKIKLFVVDADNEGLNVIVRIIKEKYKCYNIIKIKAKLKIKHIIIEKEKKGI